MNAISTSLLPASGVACPHCASKESFVKDTRPIKKGIRRRRLCFKCGTRYNTLETFYDKNIAVSVYDARREVLRANTLELLEGLSPAEIRALNFFLRTYIKGSVR